MALPIIVIGGSAGSINALLQLLGEFPADLHAAVFIVVHINRQSNSQLASVLQRSSRLPVSFAADRHPIQPARIYIAPPDYHLFVEADRMRLIRGPLENNMRPAIDVLFRSAAVAHRDLVVGVLLSGLLDDGVIGLEAIKRCGGKAIVQSPEEALFSEMPKNAIAAVEIDYIVGIQQMYDCLLQCLNQPPHSTPEPPQDLITESQMVRTVMASADAMSQIGEMVAQSCPACGGPLWQVKSAPILQHRCHIGHSFTSQALIDAQAKNAEEALWVALRTLEERSRLLERISKDFQQKGTQKLSKMYHQLAQEASDHANSIRSLLSSLRQPRTATEDPDEIFNESHESSA